MNEALFSQAISETNDSNRSILLGNGFSMSLCKNFDYKALYETSKSKLDSSQRKLFEKLNTTDFEKVLAISKYCN